MPLNQELLRSLLAPWGELRAQPVSDWKGDVPLPQVLADFYENVGPWGPTYFERVGPIGISLDVGGEPICIPPLHKLWDLQAGYRWHAITGERLGGWKEAWLLVAESGGDPFILNAENGEVLFAHHGAGAWHPQPIAADLQTAFGALATIANAMAALGDAAKDEDFNLTPAARAAVEAALESFLGSAARASEVLQALAWYA